MFPGVECLGFKWLLFFSLGLQIKNVSLEKRQPTQMIPAAEKPHLLLPKMSYSKQDSFEEVEVGDQTP